MISRLLPILLLLSFTTVDAAQFPPVPGQRYDVGGYQVHIFCMGQGSPTVIVDVGLGDDSTDWAPIQQKLAMKSRVCVFDRPGYGWSDFGPQPRNSERIAFELKTLLSKAKIAPPYVMVGHSFGGYNVRVFTNHNPNQVKGMVLVDASHEDQYERFNIKLPKNFNRRSNILILPKHTTSTSHADKPVVLRERAFNAARAEISSLNQSAMQVRSYPNLPAVPLIIVSRGMAEWYGDVNLKAREDIWSDLQQELFLLSPISRQVFANESGHNIPHEQPEIIIDAITDVLFQARSMNSLP